MIDPLDVLRFMKISHANSIRLSPGLPAAETKALCLRLIKEELEEELLPAIERDDLVEIADAIADAIFVLLFAARAYGLPIVALWREVVRTNMAKFPGGKATYDPGGKVVKPEGWQPPAIKTILQAAEDEFQHTGQLVLPGFVNELHVWRKP